MIDTSCFAVEVAHVNVRKYVVLHLLDKFEVVIW
jgi:hypothetical protein